MDDQIIDKYYAALMIIEILFKQGGINQSTYTSIKKHSTNNTHTFNSPSTCTDLKSHISQIQMHSLQ